MKEIQLAKSPQPVNNFQPMICPSVTHDRQTWISIFEKIKEHDVQREH